MRCLGQHFLPQMGQTAALNPINVTPNIANFCPASMCQIPMLLSQILKMVPNSDPASGSQDPALMTSSWTLPHFFQTGTCSWICTHALLNLQDCEFSKECMMTGWMYEGKPAVQKLSLRIVQGNVRIFQFTSHNVGKTSNWCAKISSVKNSVLLKFHCATVKIIFNFNYLVG